MNKGWNRDSSLMEFLKDLIDNETLAIVAVCVLAIVDRSMMQSAMYIIGGIVGLRKILKKNDESN